MTYKFMTIEENLMSQKAAWKMVLEDFVAGVQETMEVSFKNMKDRNAFLAACREVRNANKDITYGSIGGHRGYVVQPVGHTR